MRVTRETLKLCIIKWRINNQSQNNNRAHKPAEHCMSYHYTGSASTFPIRKPLQQCIGNNTVQGNNGGALSFSLKDIPMVSAILGACQDVSGPCSRQPFPPRTRWLTKTQQATEPKRPTAVLPSTLGESTIPILNKSWLEIENHIKSGLNEHLLLMEFIRRVGLYHTPSKEHETQYFTVALVILSTKVMSASGRFLLW